MPDRLLDGAEAAEFGGNVQTLEVDLLRCESVLQRAARAGAGLADEQRHLAKLFDGDARPALPRRRRRYDEHEPVRGKRLELQVGFRNGVANDSQLDVAMAEVRERFAGIGDSQTSTNVRIVRVEGGDQTRQQALAGHGA